MASSGSRSPMVLRRTKKIDRDITESMSPDESVEASHPSEATDVGNWKSGNGSNKRKPALVVESVETPVKRSRTMDFSTLQMSVKTTRKPSGKRVIASRIIPTSYEECEDADKQLIDMRDSGKSWVVIRKMYQEVTGDKAALSTLPNRYERLKLNFTVINEEDHPRLIEAKHEVEDAFEKEKWSLVAQAVAAKGGESHHPDVLRRAFRKLMLKEGVVPPPGIRDPDFEIDEEAEQEL